jgi:rubrerythrin
MYEVAQASTVQSLAPLSKEELMRGLRLCVASEGEAIDLYSKLSEACEDAKVKEILDDVTKEEKIHVGQFLEAIKILDKSEYKLYIKGQGEMK